MLDMTSLVPHVVVDQSLAVCNYRISATAIRAWPSTGYFAVVELMKRRGSYTLNSAPAWFGGLEHRKIHPFNFYTIFTTE